MGVALFGLVSGCAADEGRDATSPVGGVPGLSAGISGGSDDGDDTDGTEPGEPGDEDALKLDVDPGDSEGAGDEGGTNCAPVGAGATLTGKVYAPNGNTPISGALVFVTKTVPEPIPNEVFCDACVSIDCDHPFAFTEPDGSFELEAGPGSWNLVVQKGQFRRVTPIELEGGSQASPDGSTTMPKARNEAAGEFIPNVALAWGAWDRMENLLAKFGLAEQSGGFFEQTGARSFDYYEPDFGGDGGPGFDGTVSDLLDDPVRLSQYHIVFLACHGEEFTPLQIANIKAWVEEGGRLYATDLEFTNFESGFPQYQEFGGPGGGFGEWPGRVDDPDLAAWLATFGHGTNITLHDNPTEIMSLGTVMVDDLMGGEVDVSHHTWVSAARGDWDGNPQQAFGPAAISAQYGCGRILYTTYHNTPDAHPNLLPQELTMLYLILEVGACQEPAGVPEPEG